jgi:hypothetical protein
MLSLISLSLSLSLSGTRARAHTYAQAHVHAHPHTNIPRAVTANTRYTEHNTHTLYHVFTSLHLNNLMPHITIFLHSLPQPSVLFLFLALPLNILSCTLFLLGFSVLWFVCSYFPDLQAVSSFIFNHLALHLCVTVHFNKK